MAGTEEALRQLEGAWVSDPNDAETQREFGRVTQIFKPDGQLTYIAHSAAKDEVMLLTYRVEGDQIVTDQPSSPSEYRTKFRFEPGGALVLDDSGQQFRFVRKR